MILCTEKPVLNASFKISDVQIYINIWFVSKKIRCYMILLTNLLMLTFKQILVGKKSIIVLNQFCSILVISLITPAYLIWSTWLGVRPTCVWPPRYHRVITTLPTITSATHSQTDRLLIWWNRYNWFIKLSKHALFRTVKRPPLFRQLFLRVYKENF